MSDILKKKKAYCIGYKLGKWIQIFAHSFRLLSLKKCFLEIFLSNAKQSESITKSASDNWTIQQELRLYSSALQLTKYSSAIIGYILKKKSMRSSIRRIIRVEMHMM